METLRTQVTALEAAIALVLARPTKKAVHALRTSTRRIEAQLELLAYLAQAEPALKLPRKLAAKLKRGFSKLRREAGRVRDLDVQRDLIQTAAAERAGHRAHDDAKKLRNELKTERGTEAKALRALVERHSLKLSPRLEELLGAMAGAEGFTLSPLQLVQLTNGWFKSRVAGAGTPGDDPDGLHTIRKLAKTARYIAESGVEPAARTSRGTKSKAGEPSSALTRLVARFEALQTAGGTWHDLLTVRDLASKRLGQSATLKRHFAASEEKALAAFRQKLAEDTAMLETPAPRQAIG